MNRLGHENLRKATVYIGAKNYYERQAMRDLFLAQGLKNVTCHASLESLHKLIVELPPDLLVVSDDFDNDIYRLVKDIRFQKIGDNPFMLISIIIGPHHGEALDRAIEAGVDDIIIKPVSAERVQERLRLVTFHRRPFIATDGYVGPERKNEDAPPTDVHRVPVVNTLLETVNGRELDKRALKAAVEGSLEKVLQAQLDTHRFRLGEMCERLVQAYETNEVTDDVQTDLMRLADALREASMVIEKLQDLNLSGLCTSLASNVEQIASRYLNTTESDIGLIRKITMAFKMAIESPEPDGQPEAADLS
ncbi:MAG: hypothetical protein CMG46_07965 [Candidatus Marinimicrobia bacterium]|nr:hypothetical protein [Candidatus Neomarinimicrobiota bacterium]